VKDVYFNVWMLDGGGGQMCWIWSF